MDVFDLYAKLSLDSSQYDRSLQNAASSADKWATKFAMAAKTVNSAFSYVAKGIASLSVSAVKSYSNFEQLSGGIETLFGTNGKSFEEWSKSFNESSDSMQDYIDVARKVINGDFGNGAERKDLLSQAGYDPDTVQQMVNNLINGIDVASNISADTISANIQTAEEKYASLERAQDAAMENARNAYKTAGMSANEYMETVTSFAASLNQALGGDTEKAVAKADMALQDMSDNANKMGTSMESIKNAYQGFAKQNYTMLDNLKLGYGGTKSEMERLLADAQKLTGVKYDINNLSDVYDAIHAIQVETGITGTTAEEAEKTIEGSTKMMKASWQNVLTSLVTGGEFFDESLKGLTTSVKNWIHNIVPAFQGALRGISALIMDLAPVIVNELPGLIDDNLPGLVDAFVSVFSTLADNLPIIADVLIKVIPSIIEKVADAIVKAAPNIIAGLIKLAATIAKSLPKAFSSVIKGFPKIFTTAFEEISNIAPNITNFLKNTFSSLFGDDSLFSGWQESFENFDWSVLGNSILDGITSILDSGGKFLTNIFNPAKDKVAHDVNWGDIGTSMMNSLKAVLDAGASVVTGLGTVVSTAAESIDWAKVGAVIAGCINGAVSVAGGLIDTVNWEEIGKTVGDAINGVVTTIDTAINTIEWDTLGLTFGNGVNGIANTANSLLSNTDWELIGKTGADAINGTYTTIDSALTTIDWNLIGQNFGNSRTTTCIIKKENTCRKQSSDKAIHSVNG